ncbi:CPBP family intramembrane glutamic endopeptidase [Mycoplasmatota bacterium WC44]
MNPELLTMLLLLLATVIIAVIIIPYFLYKKLNHNEETYPAWLKSIGFSVAELMFVFVNLCLILVFNQLTMIPGLILALYIILLYNLKTKQKELVVEKNKKYLSAFLVVFISHLILLMLNRSIGYINNDNSWLMNTLYILPFNITLLFMYFFKVGFKDFKWNMTKKTIALALLLYLILKLLTFVLFDIEKLTSTSWLYYLVNFAHNIYYPAFTEEILFRGLLLTGLIHYGFSNSKANIIHALIFGVIHILNRGDLGLVELLSTSMQMYLGYLLGKLYLSTKSLSPNILLHGLFNVI